MKHSKWRGKWAKLLALSGVVVGAIGFGVVKAADTYGVSQQFNPNVVLSTAPLNKSTLQVTVYNLTNNDMPNLSLTDILGPGLAVAAVPNTVNSANCPGVAIAGAGQNVTISGASGIASGKSCVFSIDVEASTAGILNADIAAGSPFAASNTVPAAANAQLVVSNQTFVSPTLSHGRWEPTIYPGGVDHLVVDISNPNAAALPGGTFSFTIPAGTTLVGTPAYNHPTYNGSNPNTGCNGTVTVSGSTVTVSNLTMPPMVGGVAGYCRLDYQLTSTVVGTYAVSSPAGTFSAVGGTITNANASNTNFQVIAKPTLSLVKTFSRPVAPAVNWTIGQHPKVTLTVYNQTDDPWTNVTVADTMPVGLEVNTAVASTGSCSAAGTLTPTTASFVVPTVAANSSCTIVFETTVTSVPAGGVADNIIAANTMARDPIRGDAGQVNNNSSSDKLAIVPSAPGGGGANLDAISKVFQSVIGAGLGNTGVIDGIAGGRVKLLFTVTKTLPDGLDYPLSNVKIEDDWSSSATHLLTNIAAGSVLPASEIYANNCGVDAKVNVITAQKLVLSGLAIPLGRTSCQVGVFLNVDPSLVAPDPLSGVLETNTATACLDATNSAANCSAAAKTSNQPTIELFSAQPLQIEKTANGAKTLSLALTQQFNYNFTIKNPSSVAATNVTMVDTLPAGVRFASPLTVTGLSCVNATVGAAPTAAGSMLTWVIPTMNGFNAVGTAASCSVSVLAEADPAVAVPGTPYTNTVEIGKVTANEGATRSNTLSSQALVTFRTAPEGLVLTKAFANPVVFQDNGDATLDTNLFGSGFDEATMLQFTLFNSSTTTGFTNVSFTDTLPSGVRVRNAASPVTTGTTCVGAVVDTSVAGKVTVTVPALGATVNCKVMVQVIGTVVGSYTNTIPAKSVTTNEGATNTVPTSADLKVVATVPGISVFKDVTAAGGATTLHGTQVNPGDLLTYRLVLKNNNYPAAALKDYAPLVTDVLPVGVEFVSADNGGTASGQTVTWNFSGSAVVLDRNGTFPLNVTVRVKLDATGTLANVAKLDTSSSDCATPYAGGSCLATPPAAACVMPANPLAPTLAEITNPAICQPVAVKVAAVKHTLAKDVFATGTTIPSLNTKLVAAGDKLTYVLTLKNTGDGPLSVKDFVKTVTDKVPTGTTYVVGSASAGGTFAAGVVTWDLTADASTLAKDATRTFSFDVTVDDTAVGPLTNVGKTSTETSNTVTNPVAVPSASLVKDVFKSSDLKTSINTKVVAAGDELTYTVTLKNTGAGVLSVKDFVKTVTDKVPTGTTYVPNSASAGGTFAGGVVTWDLAGAPSLAKDATMVFSFKVTVNLDAAGTLTNVAKSGAGDSNTVTNPIAAPGYSLVKDVFKSPDLTTSINTKTVAAGDELTYTITLKNTGAGVLSVKDFVRSVSDKVPAGATYVPNSASVGGVMANGVVTWDLANSPTLGKGETLVFSFKVTVNIDAKGVLTNVAKSNGGDSNTVTNPIAVPGQVLVKDVFKTSDLSTSIDTKTVAAGDALTYKITLKNTGAGVLSLKDFVKTLTDILPKGVTYVANSADNGGVFVATPAPGVVSWDFSNSSEVLVAGGSKVFTFQVTVDATASGSINNVAVTAGTGSNTVTNPVVPPKHSLVKDVFKSSDLATSIQGKNVVAGDELTYTLTLKNTGTGVLSVKDFVKVITDTLPKGVTYVANSADNGGTFVATPAPGVVSWDLGNSTDMLAPGATKVFSFKVKVDLTASGSIDNVAKTVSEPSNPVVNPVTPPKHSLTKDVFKTGTTTSIKGTTVAAGDLLTYLITVTNTGAGDLSVKDFVKSVSDTLPAGVTVIRISEGGSGSPITVWDLSTSTRVLKPGESLAVSVDVKVNDDASGNLKNVAKSLTEDSNEVVNPVAAPKHALIKDVRKTGTVVSIIGQDVLNRDTLTYVLTIRNTGAGNLVLKTAVKELRDALPAGTVFVSASNGGIYSGGSVIWNLENDNTVLSPGASKEFSFNVLVAEDASMPLVNVALTPGVSSCPLNDASCIANPPQPVCSMPGNALNLTAAERADTKVCKPVVNNLLVNTTLVVEKLADRQEAQLGDSLKYTIRVRNAGQARASAVALRDTLPAGFRYIAGTARLSTNAVLAEPEGAPGPALTFQLGNIAAGSEITLTYRVRIGAGAVQGDGINRATACTTQNKLLCSNEGRAKVKVTGGVFTDEACIAGKVFVDVDGNRLQDAEEIGVPGVRLYMETGTFFITDVEGKYSYCGILPKSHTIKVDPATLPRSAVLVPSSNRNLGDGNSLYLDVKRGELIRGDFIIGNPTDAVLNQVKARRAQGEVSGPQNEKAGAPALVFESRKLTPLTSASPKEGINNTAEQAVPRVRDPQAGVESCAPGACDQAPLRVDPQRVLPALEGSSTSGKQ